ncbi:glucose-1-phosphate adenylyltransferase [Inmirania thermothiophila]|uniref:Glucose-1-phosphate adenylyltransferase n=1 Tax=Inmirania thermothiophila TaxID=1750597 RepID=A0A3N1Y1V7_9GAMM|nr:glucose-1-phosphate adenylyltransferase [Inmirania thermothiophila]ROR32815.1 glucose-1-phosphate adenylyltransferase [Inmirania thermothiophila]
MAFRYSARFVSRLTRDTLALVLAGGRGTRLRDLTNWRVKPAVPFGGKFRIIDFPLSNCLNSGIRRISVLTQYKAHSLTRHIQQGWNFLRAELGEFIELLPAQQRTGEGWYAGTADAVFQNLDIIHAHRPEYVLILAGDHIYKMDYGALVAAHVANDADVTVAAIEVPRAEARAFGVMAVDEHGRVTAFAEKPADPAPVPGRPDVALASMGIYVFRRAFLYDILFADHEDPASSHDFGHDVIPRAIATARVYAYPFRDPATGRPYYWRDVGTVDAFWRANLELLDVTPELNLYDAEWPIWTYQEQLPPAKFVFDDDWRRGMAVDSMVSGGCVISGAFLRRSLLFSNVRVEEGSVLEECVVLPDVVIGRGCRIRRAVIDKGTRIPDGTVIGEDEADAARFHVTEQGVRLVVPEMLGQEIHRVPR